MTESDRDRDADDDVQPTDEALDRGLEAAFGTPAPPVTRTRRDITRRAGTSQGPLSIVDLVEQRTGRPTRLMLKEEDSAHGASPIVSPSLGGAGRGPGRHAAAAAVVPTGKGNYQIMGEIARGGMGVVLKGHDTDLGRDVAMKVLLREHADSDSILQRFVEEAQIGGQLQHPGIVPVYELGLLDDDRPYFTMKLVKGRTLAALFAERSSVEEGRRRFLTIFEQVCQTIAYAHARKVIHRDLKPANIMVGAFGEVQVVDWGLAKVLREGGIVDERRAQQQQTQVSIIETVRSAGSSTTGTQSLVGSVMGTPAYMSPEQAQGEIERLDERTDVFSLGAILAEILTGKPAYTGEEDRPVTEAARALQAGLHARLDACEAAPELVDLARRCLAPGKELRPRNAAALAKEVADYLASSEERAREAELAAAEARVKAVQERKARRLTLALAATVLVAMVAAGIGYFYFEQQASAQRAADDQRRMEVSAKITGILQDAQLRRGLGEYVEALVALDQAGTVLSATSDASPMLAAAVSDLRHDVIEAQATEQRERDAQQKLDTFLAQLEDIQLSRGGGNEDEVTERRDADYAQAFLDYGIHVFAGSEEDVVQQIKATGHPRAAALALDEWMRIKLYRYGFGTPEFGRLIRMAMALDPDPWRLKLRNAVLSDDRRALETIASSEEVHSWPPETVAMFVESVDDLGHDLDVIPLLKASHIHHPENHVIPYLLSYEFYDDGQYEEALAFADLAHSLRPEFGRPIVMQLNVLMRLHRWEELTAFFIAKRDLFGDADDYWLTTWAAPRIVATMTLRSYEDEAIAFMEATLPTSPAPTLEHNNIAWYLATRPAPTRDELSKALEHAEALVELDGTGNDYNTLGTVLFQSGRYREALDALKISMEQTGGGEEFDWLLTAMILEILGVHDQAQLWYGRAVVARPTRGSTRGNPFLDAEELAIDPNAEIEQFRVRAREMFDDEGS